MAKRAKHSNKPTHIGRSLIGAVTAPTGPGPTWVPGSPGVPTPPVQPFMTAQDILDNADRQAGWSSQLGQLEGDLQRLRSETTYNLSQMDKQKTKDISDSADEMAARGVAHSSIKDKDLFDIEATARLKRDYVETQLSNAEMAAGNQRKAISDAKDAWTTYLQKKMVQNAQDVGADQNPWVTPPTQGHFAGLGNIAADKSSNRKPSKPQPPQHTVIASGTQGATSGGHASEANSRMVAKRNPKPIGVGGSLYGGGSAGVR